MYDIIICDPLWDYAGQTQHGKINASGGAITHYPTMSVDRITRMFPTQKKLEMFAREAYEGWDAWGNEVKTEITL